MKSGFVVSAIAFVASLSLSVIAGTAAAGQATPETSTAVPASQAPRPLGSTLPLCNELADRAFLEGLRTKGMMDNVRAGFKLLALKSETFNDCYGFYSFFDQRSYEGEWKSGQPHGKGTMWFTDGRTFLGEFDNGNFTGLGAEYGEDGTVTRSGRWANNELVDPMPTAEVREASGGWFNVEARKTPPPVPANQAAATKKAREEKEKREAEAAAARAAEKAREKAARDAERLARNASRNNPRPAAEPAVAQTATVAQATTPQSNVVSVPSILATPVDAQPAPVELVQKAKILQMPPTDNYYPASARASDQQGATKVRACIEPNSRVSSVEVIESSGFKDLDDAAVKLGRDGRYQAARSKAGPVASCVAFRIKFGLVDEVGGYFADARQGQQDDANNTYNGGMRDGQKNGQGTLTFPDGSTYVGGFKNNKFDGLGTYTWTNGQRYVGAFTNGNAEGRGTLTFADGGRYEGNFRDGKFNGQGTRIFANGGGSYVGEFADNEFSGQGTLTYADGRRHVGEFKNGKPSGTGTLYAANGSILQQGSWLNDMFVPAATVAQNPPAVAPSMLGSISAIATAQQAEVDRLAAERAAAERLAAERLAAEQAAAERLAAERIAAERLLAERREAERIAAERLAAERAAAERLAAERLAAERAAAERLAAERAAAERLAAERAAAQRLAAERAAAERLAAERRDAERQEAERLAAAANASATGGANGAKRVALVIGNRNYISVPPLRNARADAEAMANALEQIGFEVLLRKDLDDRGLRQAMREFKSRLDGGSEAVFYYAGHGVQLGAANYLLPINIASDSEEQVKDEALMLQRVLDDLAEQKVRFSVAIVDACRDNPFPKKAGGTRSIGSTRGLGQTTAATGQMILFSAGTGQSALDNLGPNDRDPNGVFTRVLLREMARPGVPVDQVLKRTRQEVVSLAKSVGHEQVPALYDQTIGEFFFRPAIAAPPPPAQMAATPAAAPAAAMMAALPTDDRALWESVKDSKNPEEIQAYLTQFPKGLFAGVANARLRAMQAAAPTAAAPVAAPPIASMGSGGAPAAIVAASGSLGAGKGQISDDLQKFGAGTVFRDCADCPEMVVIPPGRFEMGLSDTRKVRRPSEGPLREVTIPGTFAVGRSEVTWAQYARFARETNRSSGNGCATFTANRFKVNPQANWTSPGFQQTENDPVVCVSWQDAKAYADWLGNKTGRNYRLLTEAEWEYVARAGSKGDHFWGENPSDACRFANVADATGRNALGLEAPFDCRDRFTNTSPTTSFQPNPFGVHDLFGNAEEWVLDCWSDNYRNAPALGVANTVGDCDRRVVRGGSWFDGTETIRASARNEDALNVRFSTRGFRIARTN